MLIPVVTIISAAVGVGMCLLTGVFGNWHWLWVLPVSFVGSFLLQALLVFAVLWISAAVVDMDKVQEKDSKYYRFLINQIGRALLPFMRIKLHTEGMEKFNVKGRFLLVCNHLHDVDPVVLLLAFPKSQLAFISKRENDKMFIIGPLMRKILCQPINRENDREALKTILRCIQLIKDDTVSVAVFPEGYIRPDHLLYPFRSGVFKIAQKAKVPIVVCTVRNTHHVYNNASKFKPTDVYLHLVDIIPAQELEGVTAVDVANRVHKLMADDLGPELVLPENTENT